MQTEFARNALTCTQHYQQECIYVNCDSEGSRERLLCRKCCQQKGSIDFPLIKDIISRDMLYKEAYSISHDRKETQARYYQNLNQTFDKLMHDIIWSVEKLKIQYVESSKWFFSHLDTFRCRKILEEMDVRLYEISQHSSLQTSNVLYVYTELFKEYHKEKKIIEEKERGLTTLVNEFEREFRYFAEMIRSLQLNLEQKVSKFINENDIPYFSIPKLTSLSGFENFTQESRGKKYFLDETDRAKEDDTTLDRTKKTSKENLNQSQAIDDKAQTINQTSLKKMAEINASPSPKKTERKSEEKKETFDESNSKERNSFDFGSPSSKRQQTSRNDDYLHLMESVLGLKQPNASGSKNQQDDIQSSRTVKPKIKYSLAKLLTLTTEPQSDITVGNFGVFIETYNKCFHDQKINVFGTRDTANICQTSTGSDTSLAKTISLKLYETINLSEDCFKLEEKHFLNYQFFIHEIDNFKILFGVRYVPENEKWEVLSFDWKETKDKHIEVDSEIERNKFQQGFQFITSDSIYGEGKSEKVKAPFSKKKIMLKGDFDMKALNCKMVLFLIRVYAEQYEAVAEMRTLNLTKEMINQIFQEKFKPEIQE